MTEALTENCFPEKLSFSKVGAYQKGVAPPSPNHFLPPYPRQISGYLMYSSAIEVFLDFKTMCREEILTYNRKVQILQRQETHPDL